MDRSGAALIPASVLLFILHVSAAGLDLPQLEGLKVNILDGQVIAHWQRPEGAPSDVLYNVEISKYANQWTALLSCYGSAHTFCDLTGFIEDYRAKYRLRVQMVADNDTSAWKGFWFYPNKSELQPPSFTLWATSSTITVSIHDKPILKQLFPYGLLYTLYLEERGQEIKNTTAHLKDEVWEDGKTKVFGSLHWGVEYCVSIKVEGSGALYTSSVSPTQCLRLPEQEWFIISVSSLSAGGVLAAAAVMALGLLCYLKRPAKMPAALKSPKPGWHPLDVGEGVIEVVTDKGWFLFSPPTQSTALHATEPEADDGKEEKEEKEEERRRTSMDSGVCMGSNSGAGDRSGAAKQDDSGFASMGAPEGSDSGQTDYPLRDQTSGDKKGEDSGVWEGGALTGDADDGGDGGGSYRRQRPSDVHICNTDEVFERTDAESALAEVVTGYRAGPQACICAGAGRCTWCRKHELLQPAKARRCAETGLLSGELLQALTGKAAAGGADSSLVEFGESFPLLTSLTDAVTDVNMNHLPLSLCDVQLQSD